MAELYYSNIMTMCIEVHFRDVITKLKAPKRVRAMLEENESFSERGHCYKFEVSNMSPVEQARWGLTL